MAAGPGRGGPAAAPGRDPGARGGTWARDSGVGGSERLPGTGRRAERAETPARGRGHTHLRSLFAILGAHHKGEPPRQRGAARSPRPGSFSHSRAAWQGGRGADRGTGVSGRLEADRAPLTAPSSPRRFAVPTAPRRPPSAAARPGPRRVRHGSAWPLPAGRSAQRPLSRPAVPPPSCQSCRGLRRRLPTLGSCAAALRCPALRCPARLPRLPARPPPPRLHRHRRARGLGRYRRISRPASFQSHRLNLRRRTAAPLAAAAARDPGGGRGLAPAAGGQGEGRRGEA